MPRDISQFEHQQGATSVALSYDVADTASGAVRSESTGSEQSESDAPKTNRYALCVEYAGAAYRGWQTQKEKDVPSIQETVEKALSKIANEPINQ